MVFFQYNCINEKGIEMAKQNDIRKLERLMKEETLEGKQKLLYGWVRAGNTNFRNFKYLWCGIIDSEYAKAHLIEEDK